jgi:hypothetical protein
MKGGNYELVQAFGSLGHRGVGASKRQTKLLKNTKGINFRNDRRAVLNRFGAVTFPSNAYSRMISIIELAEKEMSSRPEDFEAPLRRYFKKTNKDFQLKLSDQRRIGKIELVSKIGRILYQYRMGKYLVLLRDSVGFDVFQLNFMLANRSRFTRRLLIAMFTGLGFILTAVPTGMTVVYAFDKFC